MQRGLAGESCLSARLSVCLSVKRMICIRPYLDFKTASIIATSVVHSKLDCCNSVYYNIAHSQINDFRISRTLLLVLSPERQNLFILTPFSHIGSHNKPTSISPQLDFCSTLSEHTFFICGYSDSSTNPVLVENH